MFSILKRWGLGVGLAACGFALGHVGEGFYLKAKYPAISAFLESRPPYVPGSKTNEAGELVYNQQTGQFSKLRDPDYDSDIERGYVEEKSAMTLGIILASALLAASAIRAGEKS